MSSGLTPRPVVPSSETVLSLMIRSPAFHAVWRSVSCGSGPRSRRIHSAGSGRIVSAPSSVRRISGRRLIPESSTPCWNSAIAPDLVGRVRLEMVALLRELHVGHQVAGPVDRARAEREQRDAEQQTEVEVRGGDRADREEVDDVVPRHLGVGHHEADGGQRREREKRGDLTLDPLGDLLVDVRRARLVRLQAGVRERIVGQCYFVAVAVLLDGDRAVLVVTELREVSALVWMTHRFTSPPSPQPRERPSGPRPSWYARRSTPRTAAARPVRRSR